MLGEPVDVEPRDRSEVMAVTLGGTLYAPSIGDTSWAPLASFHYFGEAPRHRIRAQLSGLVNEVEIATRVSARSSSGAFEASRASRTIRAASSARPRW